MSKMLISSGSGDSQESVDGVTQSNKVAAAPNCQQGGRFKCPECGKMFINKSVLDRHLRVHTGERPHICPICSKAFSQLGNMTKHMKTHENAHLRWNRKTQNKPFKCTYPGCNKSFTAKTSLQSHILGHQNSELVQKDDVIGDQTESNEYNNSRIHRAMINNHLRHHHYPTSVIYQDPLLSTGTSTNKIEGTITALTSSELPPPIETIELSSANSQCNNSPSQCLHSGCTQVFHSQDELREHIYSSSPGLVAEHQFLIDTVLQFSDIICSWESKSVLEKVTMRNYVLSVKQAIESMKVAKSNKNDPKRNEPTETSSIACTDNCASSISSCTLNLPQPPAETWYHHDHHLHHHQDFSCNTLDSAQQYWTQDVTQPDQGKDCTNTGIMYDALDRDLDHYFEQPSTAKESDGSGVYSTLLTAHNTIANAWDEHSLPVNHDHSHQQDEQIYPHKATMSWEEAIERSQCMLSKGISHPSIFINPCNSWEKFYLLDLFHDEMQHSDQEFKRPKYSHN